MQKAICPNLVLNEFREEVIQSSVYINIIKNILPKAFGEYFHSIKYLPRIYEVLYIYIYINIFLGFNQIQ